MFQIKTIEPRHILDIYAHRTVLADLNFCLPTKFDPGLKGYQFINHSLIHVVDGRC